jgi:ABC-2 type transport system permease protein
MEKIKRAWRLYLPFAKAGVKTELSYKAQIVMWIVISFIEVFFILFLYQAIYRNSPDGMGAVINGFTFDDMVLYMITSFVFSFVMGAGDTSYNIYTDIREGTIANTLTKPVSYRLRHLSTFLGMVALDVVIVMLPLMTITYGTFFALGMIKMKAIDFIVNLVFFFIFTILGCFINDAISYFVGMLVFFTDHLFGLNMARTALQGFMAGKMVPLAYMGIVGVIFSYTPFAFLGSVPVLTLMGKVAVMDIIVYILVAIAWISAIELTNHLIFSYAMKKLTVQGG